MYSQDILYIDNSKPRKDCVFCQIHNFVDMKGNKLPLQYALCDNQVVSMGMVTIQIVFKAMPFEYNTSCQHCKHYKSKQQLTLF